MITHALVQTHPVNKLLSIRLPRINWKMFLLFGFCLVLFLSILYVFQVNQIIKADYLIKDYQKKINNLVQENKNLEVNLAQISYLENIQKKTQELNFQKIQTIKYIQVLDSSLANK